MREVRVAPEDVEVRAEGFNEVEGRLPLLTRIHVHYTLRIPEGSRERVDRALETHVEKCPTAASLAGAIEVTWSADIEEAGAS